MEFVIEKANAKVFSKAAVLMNKLAEDVMFQIHPVERSLAMLCCNQASQSNVLKMYFKSGFFQEEVTVTDPTLFADVNHFAANAANSIGGAFGGIGLLGNNNSSSSSSSGHQHGMMNSNIMSNLPGQQQQFFNADTSDGNATNMIPLNNKPYECKMRLKPLIQFLLGTAYKIRQGADLAIRFEESRCQFTWKCHAADDFLQMEVEGNDGEFLEGQQGST
ncbi:unnamed protein product, partial [Amoebophrya sp. A120]|eukprot:GSA120T00019880001.1